METTVETVGWGAGDPIPGTPFRVLVPTESTEGRLVVITAEMPPGLHVDRHTHEDEDQILVVLSGTVSVQFGDERLDLVEGGVARLPRGVPHEQWNDGPTPARCLEIYTPGGFERVFEAAGRAAGPGRDATGDDYRAARGD